MEPEKKELTPREIRRKRRIRNQIIAYSAVVLVLCLMIIGGIFAVKAVAGIIKERKEMKAMAEQLEAMSVVEASENVQPDEQDPPAPEKEYTADDLLEEVVDSCIAQMSLEDKVAGLFLITPEALTGVETVTIAGSGTEEALKKYPVGGLIYFQKNIQSETQLKEMISSTTPKSKYPLFFAVDEEGGSVTRLAAGGLDVPKVAAMAEIGASGDAEAAYAAGSTIGGYLGEYGINLDFAPVADVAEAGHAALGDRSFGADAAQDAQMVKAAVSGIQGAGVSACIKHFPGLGSATADTHEGAAVSERTLEELRESDLLPFQAGIEAGVDMVMVGHIALPAVTGDNTPASLSEAVITGLLRKELSYNGIVITDALRMKAVSEQYTSAEAAVMTLQAGADMILMPENFEEAYEGVLAAVNDGTLTEARITESLERIYRVKYRGILEE